MIAAVAVVTPLLMILAVLGGIGSFATVRHLAVPWFGPLAWIVPAGVDSGILSLLAWDLLAEYLGLGWPALRWTAWAFIAATIYLNVAAAHENPTAAVMHAAMPVLFITVIEGVRHLIRQYVGLVTGTRTEHVPVSRWLLAPWSTMILARRMILWHVTSYCDGLRLEYQRLTAISRLQEQYGRWLWRWRAPLADRLALRLAPAATLTSACDGATAAAIAAGAGPADPQQHQADPAASPQGLITLSARDRHLVDAAATLLREAEASGTRLSQATLARRLRARGLSVPNQRLRWLAAAARTPASAALTPDTATGETVPVG